MIVASVRRLILFMMSLALISAFIPGVAQTEGSVDMVSVAQHGGDVSYPVLKGFANTFVQDTINQTIMGEGGIQEHLNALATFSEAMPGNLKVVSSVQMLSSSTGQSLLAVLIEAHGNISPGPPSHRYTPLMFSLVTGQKISCEQIFIDCQSARSTLENRVDGMLSDELSNYLDAGALFPFPIERFLLSDTGISFYYPERGMAWLSGKSAFLHFNYDELEEMLNTQEGAVLNGLEVLNNLKPMDSARLSIETAVNSGTLPGIPVKVTSELSQVLASYPLLHDPEGFVEGQKYQLEDDRFRGTLVLSQDGKTVTGLFSKRINLFGLITGKSKLEEIKGVLGEPISAISINAEAAALYGVTSGEMVEYQYSQGIVKFFIDESQTLRAVWLDGNKAE